ncbi:DUF4376 domain-containing protein [Novosphingobium sp.]|uniref:DUF4376 domain-containing protein n=1 Tax=Novosphingobium sp. TaxID=1874826 RepID=UPI003D6D5ADB
MFHKIGAVTIDGLSITVAVETTSAEPQAVPGGAPTTFYGGRVYTLPEGTIPEETVSQKAVAEWMVSGVGPMPRSELCTDAEFVYVSKRATFAAKIRNQRDQVRDGGCGVEVQGESYRVETDATSRVNISGSVVMAMLSMQASEAFSTDWRMADNSIISLDAAEMIQLGKTVATFVEAGQRRKNELDALIATIGEGITEEELAAIEAQILAGWPE